MKSNLRTPLIVIAAALVIIAGGGLLQRLWVLLLVVAIAIAWAAGIDPLVTRLEGPWRGGFRVPRAIATALVLLCAVAVVLAVLAVFLVTAVKETTDFVNGPGPELQRRLIFWLTEEGKRFNIEFNFSSLIERIGGSPGQVGAYLWSTTQAVFGVLGIAFLALAAFILTFFFTTMKDGILATLARLLPPDQRARAREVAELAGERMGGWLRGQLTLAFIIAGVTMPAMWALGVQYPVLVGLMGGIGELIPMVGPYLAFWPALILVLATPGHQLWQVLAVVGFFAALVLTENYFLAPTIMKRYVGLAPVTTLLAVLVAGATLGFPGVLLAIPLTAAGSAVMDEVIFPAIGRMGKRGEESAAP